MGNYHPHGDQAIYDALARLAQDFNVRYPLVDGQGNFGNIDGDNPAAQRYTEARLTAAAAALMEGLAEDAVDFRDNYDGSEREPVVLPAAFPNLLANGSSGIAVGMATNIPPHNIDELIDACLHLIKAPDAPRRDAARPHPGPGFPDRRRHRRAARQRSRRPTAPGAAASACARAGRSRISAAAPGRSSSPRSPTRCQKAQADRALAELVNAEEDPAPRRRARRERRGRPHRARAARAHRRSRRC